MPAVGAPHSAELAYQPLACLAIVGHLLLVVWAHEALGTERAVTQSANGACKGADLPEGQFGALPPWALWEEVSWCAPQCHLVVHTGVKGGLSCTLQASALLSSILRCVVTTIMMIILALWLIVNVHLVHFRIPNA